MNDKNVISIYLYSEQRAIVDNYAKDEGFSRSLALRRIIKEWAKFKANTLVDSPASYEVRRD